MSLIFITYRRNDVPGHAGTIFTTLAKTYEREKVFFDTSSVGTGERWTDRLQDAVDRSLVFLCVIGPHWDARELHDPEDVVRRELATALAKGRPVVPLLIDGARLPSREELPGDCQRMLEYQAQAFDAYDFDFYEEKLKRLPGIIDGLIARMAQAGDPAARCRLHLECRSNRGEGNPWFELDGKTFFDLRFSGNATHTREFPVGWHTVTLVHSIVGAARHGSGPRRRVTVASYRLFFEAGEYVARVEHHQPLLPFLLESYTFSRPVKR